MGLYSLNCGLLSIAVILLLPAILQVWGTVSKGDWSVSECPYGNSTNSGTTECTSTIEEVSQVAYYLAITSSVMVLFAMFSCICVISVRPSENTAIACLGTIGAVSYPGSGILSIIGCSLFASKLAMVQYGQAFFFCLSAGIITEVFTVLVFIYIRFKGRCSSNAHKESNGRSSGTVKSSLQGHHSDSDEHKGTNDTSSRIVESNFRYPGGALPQSTTASFGYPSQALPACCGYPNGAFPESLEYPSGALPSSIGRLRQS